MWKLATTTLLIATLTTSPLVVADGETTCFWIDWTTTPPTVHEVSCESSLAMDANVSFVQVGADCFWIDWTTTPPTVHQVPC